MGDHRASIFCKIEMHGHIASNEWWINQDTTGCDQRIIDWFNEQVAIAMAAFNARQVTYAAIQHKRETEKVEREELQRLKEKYEKCPPPN